MTTVSRILAEAEKLLVGRAYADVTMDQIAEAASVIKGALYHHFPSKEELYLAMMIGDLRQKRTLFTRAIESVAGSRNRLRALTAAFFGLLPPKRNLIQLVRRDANVFPATTRDEIVRAYQEALPDPIETVIRDGIRDGEINPADARLLAWHYVAIVEVALTRHADAVLEDKLDHVLDLFFCGVEGVRV